jgi:hypothetical protein
VQLKMRSRQTAERIKARAPWAEADIFHAGKYGGRSKLAAFDPPVDVW